MALKGRRAGDWTARSPLMKTLGIKAINGRSYSKRVGHPTYLSDC